MVERLLRSKAYGERWGRHWLDVVRYSDTAGETGDFPTPLSYKYRNWVIKALNADKPYDQFVREQIAGDILAKQTPGVSKKRYKEISEEFYTETGLPVVTPQNVKSYVQQHKDRGIQYTLLYLFYIMHLRTFYHQ